MSWTSWPETLRPCAKCGDQPRTHGPLCGWCNAMAVEGAAGELDRAGRADGADRAGEAYEANELSAEEANELSAEEAHEHFRFHARRVAHAGSRYPDGSMREWGADEPMPAQPDTEAAAQLANLAAFAHLRTLDASVEAMEQELCPSCGLWAREYGELCGACNKELSAAERRAPNEPTLASAIVHYCIYSDIMRQAYERMEEALLRYQTGESSEEEYDEQFQSGVELWAVTEEGLLEVREVNLKLGRTRADPSEWVEEPGWDAAPYRCTKCDETYFLLEELLALLGTDAGMPPVERLALLELCPVCYADEAGFDLSGAAG